MGLTRRERVLGGLLGSVVGDALGVPVEFTSRAERERDPVREMRGHGTHDQPAGTWSDDTSLTLCTIDALLEHGDDCDAVARKLVRWYRDGLWTAHGKVFDVGGTTRAAITRIESGVKALEAGGERDSDNGNGSLMRILPVGLWFAGGDAEETIDAAARYSAITHAHPRSRLACAIYCLVARYLLDGTDLPDAIGNTRANVAKSAALRGARDELSHFAWIERIATDRQAPAEGDCGGYVVGSLRAAIWCASSHATFDEAVLAAVNLGGDTDTNAAITGGLVGIIHGIGSVRRRWLSAIADHDRVVDLCGRCADRIVA